MHQRHFPHKDIQRPSIGLGLAALGRPGYINLGHAEDLEHNYDKKAMEAHTHQVLDLAFQQGVRYFDAARSYGEAEAFLLSWIEQRHFKKGEIVIGSKWGYTYTAGWQVQAEHHEIKEHSLAVLNRQWKLSRQLLPHLQLYQIHSATFESGVLDNTEVLNRLAILKMEGVLIGLSTSGPHQADVLARAMEVRIDGQPLFDSVQATLNLLTNGVSHQLNEAHQEGMIVIIKEALANGRLTNRNNSIAFSGKKMILNAIAKTKNVSIDAIALAYLLHFDFVSIVLSGAASTNHLQSNLQANDLHLTEVELNQLNGLYLSEEKYWNTRSQLAWN